MTVSFSDLRFCTGSHLRGPSIDHIVPLIHGGGDVPGNVQLAHRQCNSRKGDRLGLGVQPAFF